MTCSSNPRDLNAPNKHSISHRVASIANAWDGRLTATNAKSSPSLDYHKDLEAHRAHAKARAPLWP